MEIEKTYLEGVYLLTPKVFQDERGYFFESFNKMKLPKLIRDTDWVQENESKSVKGVLRGLHYQCGAAAQAKLVRVVQGKIYDVAVDIRKDSSTYGQWFGIELSAENKKQLYIPRGFAHGFTVLSDEAIFYYKCDNYYSKEDEGGIHYRDPQLDISWPISNSEIIISAKDEILPSFGTHKNP